MGNGSVMVHYMCSEVLHECNQLHDSLTSLAMYLAQDILKDWSHKAMALKDTVRCEEMV